MPENGKILPKTYNHDEIEQKWNSVWETNKIYQWDANQPREKTFVVDTPPPTVSGSLHVGHAYSYAQTDVLVRYQRMLGKNIFYPMGWDDNGLPTERRAQNVYNIFCEPHLPFNPDWKPSKEKTKELQAVSRQNFIQACHMITAEDEIAFENTWKKLGLSVDWSLIYTTIGEHCQRISQLSFLDLIKKGMAYCSESITMWDVDFKTAVSQAEVEDREVSSAYHDLKFGVQGGGEFIISTTRPELLAACIGVAAHPSDKRYQAFFGKRAITPLFYAPVPIVASEHADPEKGSGILMICTFGDVADVEWWKKSGSPSRQIIGMNGRLLPVIFGSEQFSSLKPEIAQKNYDHLVNLPIKKARKVIIELLKGDQSAVDGQGPAMQGEPKMITHAVRFYEKGDQPLEFISTRQWFINIMDYKNELYLQGRKIHWHPDYMRTRYEHWVEGLNQDWCISRQRYFGVPLPVWYPLLENGLKDYQHPIFPKAEDLPIDPLIAVPDGYSEDQRGKPYGFAGDEDVMDTWGTSSLTPQISSYWGIDPNRHKKLFPADLRPQAHDIIRTWAFYTIAKAWMHESEIPWKHAAISGFILDPDRKKMSKSKGNTVTPESLLNQHSSDVFRYWASRGRLGVDSAFDETLFKIGRKLVIKLFNASKFVLVHFSDRAASDEFFSLNHVSSEFDRIWLDKLRSTMENVGRAFESFDYTTALQISEESFWIFCDHYLELVKYKAYQHGENPDSHSALVTLNYTLKTFLRLFAPFLPFITEEIWSWWFGVPGSSIHVAAWPAITEIAAVAAPKHNDAFELVLEIISAVRGSKTLNQVSQKTPVLKLSIQGKKEDIDKIYPLLSYILETVNAQCQAELVEDETRIDAEIHFAVTVELGQLISE
jgi:valyl-tRNA synthetase